MEEQGQDSSGRLLFDCLSALVLLLTALLGAYLPRHLSNKGANQSGTATSLAFHLGNMLSGGVMLSAGFCHLLADSLRQLAFIGRFPIATFLAAVGYLITLLADQLVQVLTAEPSTAAPGQPGKSAHSHSYVRLDRQHSSEAIEMIAHPAGWGGPSDRGLTRGGSAGFSTGRVQQQVGRVQSVTHALSEGGGGLGLATAGFSKPAGAAAVTVAKPPNLALLSLGLSGGGVDPAAGDATAAGDVAVCLLASGSPRAITAASTFARSTFRAGAAGGGADVSSNSSSSAATGASAAANGHHHHCCQQQQQGLPKALWSLTDDLLPSHPATPDMLHQQQQSPAVMAADGLACQQQQQGVLANGHGSAPRLPCSQLLRSGSADCHDAAGDHKQQQQTQQLGGPQLPLSSSIQQHSSKSVNSRSCCQLGDSSPQQQQQLCCNGGGSSKLNSRWQHSQGRERGDGSDDDDAAAAAAGNGLLGSWAEGAFLEGPGLQGSSSCSCGRCCCCQELCHGGVCQQQGLMSHPEAMTEAATVARVAGHLELEVQTPGTAGAGHNHAHFQVLLSHHPLSFATTVLLACALCIHSILEGIALGAQQSMQATQDIMLAIAAHKGLAAYALGASIVESKASAAKFWAVVAMFAVATPLGIAIGYAFSNIGHGSVSAAMSALASGTFLYVALNEVIPKELEHPDGHRLLKVAALLLGFGLMSLLAVWA